MKNRTVQVIPDRIFESLSRHSFGEEFKAIVNGFPYATLIQPIKVDSQGLAIGLNRDTMVSHFFLFDSPEAYKEKTNKDHKVLTIFAGKVEGIHGSTQFFKNRVYYDVLGKVNSQQNFLHATTLVLRELDSLCRKLSVQNFEQEILISEEFPLLEVIPEDKPTILNV